MARTPVQAAGGIVLRQAKQPLIAVVRLRKRNEWVLPKGKLDDGETPREAAEREVNEETGHDVIVHEFLGTLVYESGGRSKVVHYWRMEADGDQVYELMADIREVDWLPLEVALVRLSRTYERVFLEHVGPRAVDAAIADLSRRKAKVTPVNKAAAPARKRRARPAVPVQPPPAVPVPAPVLLAAPVPLSVELPPAVSEVPEIVASEPAGSTRILETPEPLPTTEAQESVTAGKTVEQPEPIQSAGPVESVAAMEDPDLPAREPEPVLATETDPILPAPPETADAPATDAAETRRKSLGEMLRNWLGSVA
jgi:8-oxo-dGTP diphosphatase